MDLKAVEKAVSRIQATLFRRSNSFSIGVLKSHFRGSGLQFKEHQVYNHGDEVRFIDWKMLAKTNHPYIKTFEEERNVEISVVIDVSPTMFIGHNGVSKLQAAIEICCLLYLLAKETGDFVTAIVFADDIYTLPKKNGKEGITYLISLLENKGILTADGNVNLAYNKTFSLEKDSRVRSVLKHLHKRKEVVLLSDFNDFINLEEYKKIFYRSNIHSFQLLCPIDEAEHIPYKLNLMTPSGVKKYSKVNFGKKRDLDSVGKRFKKIRIEGPYLDLFIKELV